MAQSLHGVKRRIKSIDSTRKITSAMKLVSNVKMAKYKKQLMSLRSYMTYLEDIFNDVIFYNEKNNHKQIDSIYLKENNESDKTLYILLTSDIGLCGSFNNDLIKYFEKIYKNGDEVVIVGTKAEHYFKDDKETIIYDDFIDILSGLDMNKINVFSEFLVSKFKENKFNKICLVYQRFVNSLLSVPSTYQILPLEIKENEKYVYDPEYLPNKTKLIDEIVPRFVAYKLYEILYESLVSENNARRNAMDNADKNASDMIDKLTLEYNKQRQQSITQEITEVVAGGKK